MQKLGKAKPFIVLLVIILAVSIAAVVFFSHVPALKDDVEKRSYFDADRMYIVSQMPIENALQIPETREGVEAYWKANHKYAKGIEAQMQITKDSEIIVFSGDLSDTDAGILYGQNNASVSNLTLEQLQSVNLLYNVKDENDELSFRNVSDLAKPSVSVLTLSEYLQLFNDADKITALHFLRFKDEDAVSGWTPILDKIYKAVSDADMLKYTVLCIENSGGIKYVDEVLPDLMRAASKSELRSLILAGKFGVEMKDLPYVMVYGTNKLIGSEKFVHYAKNCGLAVVVQDTFDSSIGQSIPSEDEVKKLREYGVNAIATHAPQETSAFLRNAIQASKAARTNAD